MPFWIAVGIIFLLTGVAFSYGSTFVQEREQAEPPIPPATVDGREITESEVSRRLSALRDTFRQQRPFSVPDPIQEIALRSMAVEQAVDRLVLLGEGRLRGYEPSAAQVDALWEREVERYLPPSDDEGLPSVWGGLGERREALKELRTFIASLGMTEGQYRTALAEESTRERVEADLQSEARDSARRQAEGLADVVRDAFGAGDSMAQVAASFSASPAIVSQPSRWITRSAALDEGLDFDALWAAAGGDMMEVTGAGNTWFLNVLETRAAEGPDFEAFVSARLDAAAEGDEVRIGGGPSQEELAEEWEAVRAETLRIVPPLEANVEAMREALRRQHQVEILDPVVVAFRVMTAGRPEEAWTLADAVLVDEPDRTDALAICAAARLAGAAEAPSIALAPPEGEEGAATEADPLELTVSSPEREEVLGRAVECALHAVVVSPYEPGYRFIAGRALIVAGRQEESVEHLVEAQKYRGQDLYASFTLADLFRQAGRDDLAEAEEAEQASIIDRLSSGL